MYHTKTLQIFALRSFFISVSRNSKKILQNDGGYDKMNKQRCNVGEIKMVWNKLIRFSVSLAVAVCLAVVPLLSSGAQVSASEILRGDVNGDGRINTSDYVLAKRCVLGTVTLSSAQKTRVDVNADGRVNVSDYVLLKRHVMGTYNLHGDNTNYDNHLFLKAKGKGNCETLSGKICLMLVFVSDNESYWDAASRAEAEQELCQQMIRLGEYAADFGVDLPIYYGEWDVTVSADVESYNAYDWQEKFVSQVGYDSFHDVQTSLENAWDVASAPLVFVLNKEGRAAAFAGANPTGEEFLTVYSSDYDSFCHEMFHLYGAEDFYYPMVVSNAATQYLSGSIMFNGDKVDDLTAYIVGWKKTLTEDAKGFLKATAHLTEKDMAEADKAEQLTGYGTKYYADGGVYTGYMEFGTPHGQGTMWYGDGGYYEGGWHQGNFHGSGTFVWASGDKYRGDFVHGQRTGQGTFWWTNGSRYVGSFVDGQLYGYGTYYDAYGKSQYGYWVNGVLQ